MTARQAGAAAPNISCRSSAGMRLCWQLRGVTEGGSHGQDVEQRSAGEDRTRYRDKVRRYLDVFARMLRERRFEAEPPLTGLEIELNLVDERRPARRCATPTC